jgi:hypothetical protein
MVRSSVISDVIVIDNVSNRPVLCHGESYCRGDGGLLGCRCGAVLVVQYRHVESGEEQA